MANHSHPQATLFHLVLDEYKAKLSHTEKDQFKGATLEDLQIEIKKIQDEQASKKRLQGMRRLEGFLEGMKEYDKVISIFLNSNQILAFVWGPMKFLLQTACTFAEAFDELLNAYEQIGMQIPLLTQYEQHFHNLPHMALVLRYFYEDILDFHWQAMRFFRKKVWKQLFPAVWKTFNAEFRNILRNLSQHRQLIESQASIEHYAATMKTQEEMKEYLKKQNDEEILRRRVDVYQWLAAATYEVDHETLLKVRYEHPSTGKWLFKMDKFRSWFDRDFCSNHMLWLTGIPGAGKTVLASLVIEEARKLPETTVAFFYCKYQDPERNTFVAVIRGIIAQLLHQSEGNDLLAYLFDEKSKSGQSTLATDTLALKMLEVAVKSNTRLYIVIDGIDECENGQRKDIVTAFESMWDSLPANDKDILRCLFISQDDRAARKDFSRMVSLQITEDHLKDDIRAYAKAWSSKIQAQFQLSSERRNYVEDMVTGKADGMFLYARLMSYHLYSQTSVRALENELSPNVFPQGPSRLEDLYGRIISNLFGCSTTDGSDAMKLLCWLVCARRPLKWHEIQCAVSVNFDESAVHWDQGRFRVDHKDLCGSLVDIRADQSVTVVHHTVKQYLVEKKLVDTIVANRSMASLCVEYLTLQCFDPNCPQQDLEIYVLSGQYGFLDYAYAYWSRHLEGTLADQQVPEAPQELLEAVSLFVELHWSSPDMEVSVPRFLKQRLKSLESADNFDKIAAAVQIARTRLLPSAGPIFSSDQVEVQFERVLIQIRGALERVLSSETDILWKDRFQQMYGSNYFKCPRVNCVWFYNGFPTKEKRDDHVQRHERAYFCSYSGCHVAELGCTTLKELQKHEAKYHGTMDFDGDDEDEFPEQLPEKVSFDCEICGAVFTRKHTLKNHTRIKHSDSSARTFLCSTCGKGFARKGDLKRHDDTAHSDASKFTCGGSLSDGTPWGCGREFNRGDILKRHWDSAKGKACLLPKKQEEEALQSSTATPQGQGTGTPSASQ